MSFLIDTLRGLFRDDSIPVPDHIELDPIYMYRVRWSDGEERWYDSYEQAKQAGRQRAKPSKLHKGTRTPFYVTEFSCRMETGWMMG